MLNHILGRDQLQVAVRQRAKFEGWLKIELATGLLKQGWSVELEKVIRVKKPKILADIAITDTTGFCPIMLKTVNTNFVFPGVQKRRRPITRNVNGIKEDVVKLALAGHGGFVVFVVFPLSCSASTRKSKWQKHHAKILDSGATQLATGFVVPGYASDVWGVEWQAWVLENQ